MPLPIGGFDAQRFFTRAEELLGRSVVSLGGINAVAQPPLSSRAGEIFGRIAMPQELFIRNSPGSRADIGWLLAQDPNYAQRSMNDELIELHQTAKARRPTLPNDADNFAYLFVPGLFTEHYPGYMSENMRRLKERGLKHVSMAKIDTDAGVRTNAAALKTQIEALERETGKKVVLLGHSKGGVDAGAALQLYPELHDKVQAFISMQAPFGGTPVASDLAENAKLDALMGRFIRQVFKGDPDALTDLSYRKRRELLGERVTFTQSVPTFSLGSSSRDPGSLTAVGAYYGRERYNKDGDGLVLRDDSIIPGSRGIVLLEELDHAGPTMGGNLFSRFRPGDLTEAMIALALKHSRV
jgi:triacylglycerol esterase/lipase EstA (alpha/beta hydrolase family)